MICADESVHKDRTMYHIFLCSVNSIGKEFFDPKKHSTIDQLSHVYKVLINSGIPISLIVKAVEIEKSKCIYFIADTKLLI